MLKRLVVDVWQRQSYENYKLAFHALIASESLPEIFNKIFSVKNKAKFVV